MIPEAAEIAEGHHGALERPQRDDPWGWSFPWEMIPREGGLGVAVGDYPIA